MRRLFKKKKIKIRRRGVVRTIDFLVSFTLFIILLTQFYLIIINMNLNLATISTTEENPAQLFADKILSSSGSKDWGISAGVPQNFGLAPDQSHTGFNYYLDLAKLAHLNSELQYLSINSSYSYITPNELLSNVTGSQSNVQFRITTSPIIQVQVSETHTATLASISISSLTWSNLSISNVDVNVYLVSLSTGSYSSYNTTVTGTNGKANVQEALTTDDYVAIIFAHSQDSWGINWILIQNTAGPSTISATNITSFSLNNPFTDNNSILQFTSNNIGIATINTCNAYYSTNLNNLTIYTTTGPNATSTELTNIGTNSPFIQVYSLVSGSTYYYRVVTQPLIFNNANFVSPSDANYSTGQFPVYQTTNFQNTNSGTIYTYSTPVMTQRGPILFTVDYSS